MPQDNAGRRRDAPDEDDILAPCDMPDCVCGLPDCAGEALADEFDEG